jgi:hypothetical protein
VKARRCAAAAKQGSISFLKKETKNFCLLADAAFTIGTFLED